MKFNEIVMQRYAAKAFNTEKIDKKKVDELFEMIRFAPSSFNLQPWKIVVVKDQKTKDALQPLSWNQPQIGTCSHLLVFCADTNVLGLIDRLEKQLIENGADKQKISGYVEMMRSFVKNKTPEQLLSWAQHQVYLALGNALNGAKALGFDSCPIEGFDPKGYKEVLKLPAHIHPTVVCPIGFASDQPKSKVRFPSKDIFL